MTDDIEAVRRRHQAIEPDYHWWKDNENHGEHAHADRATLLRALERALQRERVNVEAYRVSVEDRVRLEQERDTLREQLEGARQLIKDQQAQIEQEIRLGVQARTQLAQARAQERARIRAFMGMTTGGQPIKDGCSWGSCALVEEAEDHDNHT